MSDTLASINVDQLSSAVNAVVHPADSSTQPDNGTTARPVQPITSNQMTGSNIQVQVPISNLPAVAASNHGNTITIGNNAVPVMLVRVANPTNQLTNQVHSLPLTVTNQVQTLPVARAVAPNAPPSANIVGQLGNVAIALQPKAIPMVQSAPIQTFTLPNVNQAVASSVGNPYGNQNNVATDLLNLTAAQNVTFGNILSVQQKPSSDVLVLNPTGLQLNPNNTSTALAVPSTSNAYSTVSTATSQSPAVNLNLNINLPSCSTQQLQPALQQVTGSTVQAIQTTPVKAVPHSLGQRIQLPQQVYHQILQPVVPSNSIMPSSVVNIPVASLLSPNNVLQQTAATVPTSNITYQMAPVLQAVPAVASSQPVKVIQQQPATVVSQMMTQMYTTPQTNNHPIYQMSQLNQTITSQVQGDQTSQSVTHVVPSESHTVTCTATQVSHNTDTQNVTSHQVNETYTTSHVEPAESIDTSEQQNQLAHDIAALAAWPPLQITQSSTTTTLTSTSPQSSTLEPTTCPTDMHTSSTTHVQSLPLNITCDDSTAAHGSLPLTSVTSHLTSILSDLARPITTSSDADQEVHVQLHEDSGEYHQQQHPGEAAQSHNNLHMASSDGTNHLINVADPVSTASMVAGVTAEDMEGLDITIPPSLAGLSVVAADFLHDEIVTGVWCIDCKKYNDTACTKHGPIVFIRESLMESRAKQTLPKILSIKPSKIASKFVGVFARETIQVRTQFGPVQGKVVSRDDEKTLDVDSPLVWKIYSEGNLSHFIDTADERVSNWMMFVKLARTEKDQNLVAHQQGGAVYFTTIKTIECGEELYVWYCKDYTMWLGIPTKPEDTFACHLCPMQFSKIAQLKGHNKYSHANMNPRRWKCNMCARAFDSQSKLSTHILVHMGVRPHKCEHCDKTFTDPSNLRQHKLIHTGVKKFACTLCNKSFRQKAHLEAHLVIHTGERKFKCKYCDAMFARPNDVTQHMYKHTKEKEVNCDICGRAFWRKGHLKKHQKMHAGERDFHCTQCTKAFFTSYHLKRHLQVCKGPKGQGKQPTSKKGDLTHDKTPIKPVRTSSSRGRPLKPKPPFTIEARPSRLRRKTATASSSSMVHEFPPSTEAHLQTEQRSGVSEARVIVAMSTEVTSSSTVGLLSEVSGDKGDGDVQDIDS